MDGKKFLLVFMTIFILVIIGVLLSFWVFYKVDQ
ncbi:putative nucleic acid-binding Zn ribbon protein [Bhargavaea ullalensis]|uniref:Nucleic acid-binding Zn ribbon protein n=1 Tax=Bhargavaea ullalensis TaxID=1265685 RepID=A0ABV2G8D3_9BACL